MELYGYTPGFHDATFQRIEVDFDASTLLIVLDYRDTTSDEFGSRLLETRWTIEWTGVGELHLGSIERRLEMCYVMEFDIVMVDNRCRTTFVLGCGSTWVIESAAVNVRSVEKSEVTGT